MKILILGYGKMGKAIEQVALKRGHSIVYKTDFVSEIDASKIDVAIDFSVPEAAFTNISFCLNNSIPIVSGTTGWLNDYNKAVDLKP